VRAKVSVVLCSYNGQKYIQKQIESILVQLEPGDELIIQDDLSNDQTFKILQRFKQSKIKIFQNEANIGFVKNFLSAIQKASNEIILLSDQDDIWLENRLNLMYEVYQKDSLVISDFKEVDDNLNRISSINNDSRTLKLSKTRLGQFLDVFFGRNKYYGCCFLFSKKFFSECYPPSSFIPSHDIWLAINASLHGKIILCHKITLLRRIHSMNVSSHNPRRFYLKIIDRIRLGLAILYGIVTSK